MTKNLTDLNDYLFQAIERLSDPTLSREELDKEIERSETITKASTAIIQSGTLELNHKKFMVEQGFRDEIDIPLLESRND